MQVPFLSGRHVEAAVSPERAVEAVRAGFVAHARGEWTMQPKLYVTNYPAGDFRAMPALGGGHALLKWVTSFPGNPARGLPTVTGLVLLSNAETGALEAVMDAGAVTALRTGAAAVLSAETLGRSDAGTASVIGVGVNGEAAARTFLARGRDVLVWDVDVERAAAVADRIGASVAPSRAEALGCDVVATVTPGKEIVDERHELDLRRRALHGCDGEHAWPRARGRDASNAVGERARQLRRQEAGDRCATCAAVAVRKVPVEKAARERQKRRAASASAPLLRPCRSDVAGRVSRSGSDCRRRRRSCRPTNLRLARV